MGASGVEVGGKYVDTEKAREIAVLDPGFTCKRLLFDAEGEGEKKPFSLIFSIAGELSILRKLGALIYRTAIRWLMSSLLWPDPHCCHFLD